MIGARLPDGTDWSPGLAPGSYWRSPQGDWVGLTPTGLYAGLAKHDVVEHEDGTITVSPSILVHRSDKAEWHGWLERGVWRET